MTRFLFLTWPGAGNQVPAAGLAHELTARGHHVTFAGYQLQRERFESAGFAFRNLEAADRDWPTTPPEDWMPVLAGLVWASPQHLGDVATVIEAEDPDVLVVDCLMFGALAAAERSGLPTAVLVHSAPGALVPPGGALELGLLQPVNAVRALADCAPVDRLWDAWLGWLTLCTSIAELDPLADQVPESFRFVGPIIEPSPPSGWRSPWPEADPRPLTVVSFSTGPAWDQSSRIQRTLDALGGRHRLLVSTGCTDPPALSVRGDAVLVQHIPHAEVLPAADVLISHAGHGTVAAGCAHGVPQVLLPNLAADQPALAARVEKLGAGLALDGDAATPAEIAAAVTEVRGERYRSSAAGLAAQIGSAPGVSGAADLLETIAPAARSPSAGP